MSNEEAEVGPGVQWGDGVGASDISSSGK
ncbi:uncharacterized protein G2W53_037613 [Senna tora]|uniref:Uncharacterized protein n=1 Tax=Senna tora TaxID=362788 RepID=A0A834SKN8_9FABA|nr:uncharacterized protein G2W53_037613 [Senna tora]